MCSRSASLALVFIALWALLADGLCGWEKATWQGAAAWVGDSGEWRAVVSEDRARLIYLGPRNSQTNLLYAPEAPKEYRPRGGHIFWLGPQSEWTGKWGTWPPPDEWEQKPCSRAEPKGDWLHLTMPRPSEKLPQLSRAYAWESGRLLCRVSWAGGQGDYQAIQIIQLPAGAVVQAKRTGKTPPGFVRFDTLGKQGFEATTTGPDTKLITENAVELTADTAPAKFGFLPQTLKAKVGGYTLEMGREPLGGAEINSPDQGFETQVYFGAEKFPFVEIEQLTPRLLTREGEGNAFTIWLRPGGAGVGLWESGL